MKKILTVSIFAIMAVSAANADIASTTYVDTHIQDDAVNAVATGSANGTIKVDGTDVAVKGLGSAAYTASTAYATAAQGTKADNAASKSYVDAELAKKQNTLTIDAELSSQSTNPVQNKVVNAALAGKQATISDLAAIRSGAEAGATAVQTVETGSANGTISVDGTDVAVKGLGSAAYTPSTAYATAEQGTKADNAASKSYVDTELAKKQNTLTIDAELSSQSTNPVQNKVVNAALATKATPGDITSEIQKLDVSSEATGLADGKYVVEVTQTDGKIAPKVVAFDTKVEDGTTSTNAPTSDAVKSYVQTKFGALSDSTGELSTSLETLTDRVVAAEGDIDGLLSSKANAADVYTKTQADTKFIDTTEIQGYATDSELTNGLATKLDKTALTGAKKTGETGFANGTYTLTMTVSNGVQTYYWEQIGR